MTYCSINEILIEKFPELNPIFNELFRLWGSDNPPPHCFFGDTLNPYITGLLRASDESDRITKVFNFYEELALCDDEEVRNLLQVTLLEYLWDEKLVYERACTYMLPATKQINVYIGDYLNKPTS